MSSAAVSDRNLIFAILAIQNDLVSRDGVIAAMNAWISAKHKPISQILVEQGSLDPDDAAAIDGMISRIIRKSGGDVHKTLESLSSVAELAAPLAALGDTDLTASLSVCAEIPTFVANPQSAKAAGPRLSPSPDSPPRGPILSDPDGELPENLNITPAPEPRPGDVIGRFRIIRLVGKGGQGAVYEAHDLSELDRTVALKTTLEGLSDSPEILQRRRTHLLREGRLNARLEHQFIIPVHGLGTTEEGRPFYAMRLLDQINLDTAIHNFHTGKDLLHDPKAAAKNRPKPGENRDPAPIRPVGAFPQGGPTEIVLGQAPVQSNPPLVPVASDGSESGNRQDDPLPVRLDRLEGQRNLDFRNLLERFTDICEAMHFAHTRRVLHRDLKPGNIMIGPNGETLVIDWGMAKTKAELQAEALKDRPANGPESISAEIDDQYRMSVEGRFIGTLGFAAPEQLAGDLTKLNETTDVYSLGMILFEVLTGRNPFYTQEFRSTPRDRRVGWLLAKSREAAPDPLAFNPFVPKPLAAICRKALAPNQFDRYSTAAELSTDVSNWLADERVTAYRERKTEWVRRWVRKNRGKAATIGSIAISVPVFAVLFMMSMINHKLSINEKNFEISKKEARLFKAEAELLREKIEAERIKILADQDKAKLLENERELADRLAAIGTSSLYGTMDHEVGRRNLEKAIEIRAKLAKADPSNKNAVKSLADTYDQYADLLTAIWSKGNLKDRSNIENASAAIRNYKIAIENYRELIDNSDEALSQFVRLASANASVSCAHILAIQMEDYLEAKSMCISAIRLLEVFPDQDSEIVANWRAIVQAYMALGNFEALAGNGQLARANYLKAISLISHWFYEKRFFREFCG